ncbi:MAG: Rhodanese- sulfurtransferase [Sclerophora amabilis]|nr:MAG: Rhodanese- sulfurtransferase [Sclerophora amabilis]
MSEAPPTVLATNGSASDADSKPQRLPVTVNRPTPYTFDLGYLLASDPNPLTSTTEAALSSNARDGAQALLNQLMTTCPIESTSSGVLLTLPNTSTALPREKRLPPQKTLTKWQQFAAKKGIKDKKKGEGKLVYDEATAEWVPKYGYKGVNKKEEGQWLVEVDEKAEKRNGEGEARTAGRRERKDGVRRNERRMKANERRARKSGA